MVGRSIADIYEPRQHIYQSAKHQDKYTIEVIYTHYRLTYHFIYEVYAGDEEGTETSYGKVESWHS